MKCTLIPTIITAIATLALAIIAGTQIFLLRKERNANLIIFVIEYMLKLRPNWNEVFGFPAEYLRWSTEQRNIAREVCVGLQQIAYLAQTNLCSKRYLKENYAAVFYRCWIILEDFIRSFRLEGGDEPLIKKGAMGMIHLEKFSLKCKKFLKRKHRVLYSSIESSYQSQGKFF